MGWNNKGQKDSLVQVNEKNTQTRAALPQTGKHAQPSAQWSEWSMVSPTVGGVLFCVLLIWYILSGVNEIHACDFVYTQPKQGTREASIEEKDDKILSFCWDYKTLENKSYILNLWVRFLPDGEDFSLPWLIFWNGLRELAPKQSRILKPVVKFPSTSNEAEVCLLWTDSSLCLKQWKCRTFSGVESHLTAG